MLNFFESFSGHHLIKELKSSIELFGVLNRRIDCGHKMISAHLDYETSVSYDLLIVIAFSTFNLLTIAKYDNVKF